MKLIIRSYFFVLVAVISLMGCTKEDVLPPPPTTILATVSSQRVDTGQPIVFTDNSRDELSRTWTFPGGTPASSTDAEVSVAFSVAGTYTCVLEINFEGGITNSKEFKITVSDPVVNPPSVDGFANRNIFSFENATAALASWRSWSPEATSPGTLSVDASNGANGTSSSGKVTFTASGKEMQIFTNEDFSGINAKMDKTKKYEFSFWAKASAATTITVALENSVDITKHTWATQNQAFKNYLWQDKEIGTTWTKYTFNIDPSSQTYDIAENVYVKIKMVPSSTMDIWLDEFSLKEVVATANDGYANRDIFSFQSATAALTSWKSWSPETTSPATLSVDATQGANLTSSSGKVSFTATGKEIQIFTNEDFSGINAKMDKTKKYEFSFWAKASAATTITAALENSVDITKHTWATENQAFKNYLWQDTNISVTWTKYTFDIDPSSQDYAMANNVYVKIKMVPSALVDIWFDEFSLKEK